jgi:hypothetical protein
MQRQIDMLTRTLTMLQNAATSREIAGRDSSLARHYLGEAQMVLHQLQKEKTALSGGRDVAPLANTAAGADRQVSVNVRRSRATPS